MRCVPIRSKGQKVSVQTKPERPFLSKGQSFFKDERSFVIVLAPFFVGTKLSVNETTPTVR